MLIQNLEKDVNYNLLKMKNIKNIPPIIIESKCITSTLDYKWNDRVIEKLFDPLQTNEELEITLNRLNQKASLALAAALLEWVYWRFKKHTILFDDLMQRIESLWCSIESHENTKPLIFDPNLKYLAYSYVKGPIWVALVHVKMIDMKYRKGSDLLQSELVGLVLLVRHITPKQKVFDSWFMNSLFELTSLFPIGNHQTERSEMTPYDFTTEPVICREFFFNPNFKYSDAASRLALREFISNIDLIKNKFCLAKKELATA
jgi:hypothetical protein